MSSRKKRNQADIDRTSSNRNLDGRRLRTVNEAKALAEYLTVKPEMEKREKEERRRRWEAVVEMAERREEEVKGRMAGDVGAGAGAKGRIDGRWVEEKEEVENKMREAIGRAMEDGLLRDRAEYERQRKEEADDDDEEDDDDDDDDEEEAAMGSSSSKATTPPSGSELKVGRRKIFGWDDEEDADDDDDDDDEDSNESDKEVELKTAERRQ